MDSSWVTGTIYGISMTTVFGTAFALYKCLNHRRLLSKCCRYEIDVSLDITDTPLAHPETATAPLLQSDHLAIQIPASK